MILADRWKDYQVLDTGDGEKLETWAGITLRRPDPQVIWPKTFSEKDWRKVDAYYRRSNQGGGKWTFNRKLPDKWKITYKLVTGDELKFNVEPTGFKHTGLFPEQAANWDWAAEKIKNCGFTKDVRILNLFAYTGGATCACASAGAMVCHVDASKGMVTRAKENINSSRLTDRNVRFIVDDVVKFVQREIRRGNKYHGIIMDPPSYGRGPKGEIWKIEEQIFPLVELCSQVLDDNALFFIINSYTTGLQPQVLSNILHTTITKKMNGGTVSSDELGIPLKSGKVVLPCGATGRWSKD